MLACGARAILAARDGADTVGNSEGRMSETEIDEIIDKAQETSSMLAEVGVPYSFFLSDGFFLLPFLILFSQAQ